MSIKTDDFTLPSNSVKAYIIIKDKNTHYRIKYEKDKLGKTYASDIVKIGTKKKLQKKYKRYPKHIVRIAEFGFSLISSFT